MRIGIIGAGNVGTGIGRRLAAAGHAIALSFTRDPAQLEAAALTVGRDARIATPAEAVTFGAVVLLATPWAVTLDAVRSVAPALAGKVVWDATNALKPDMTGLVLGTTVSGGEEVAAAAPGARVVKAVPPFAELLHAPSMLVDGRRPGVFVCGDDPEARATILGLVADIGAEGIEAGSLTTARYTEPLGMLLVQLAYGQGMGARIGASLLREPFGGAPS